MCRQMQVETKMRIARGGDAYRFEVYPIAEVDKSLWRLPQRHTNSDTR